VVAACVVVMCWLMGDAPVFLRELHSCEHLSTDTPTTITHTHTLHTICIPFILVRLL
jgi:hypothetical protein